MKTHAKYCDLTRRKCAESIAKNLRALVSELRRESEARGGVNDLAEAYSVCADRIQKILDRHHT